MILILLSVVAGVGVIGYCISAAAEVYRKSNIAVVKVLAVLMVIMGLAMIICWIVMVVNNYNAIH